MIVTGYQARTLLGLSAWTGRKVFQQPVKAALSRTDVVVGTFSGYECHLLHLDGQTPGVVVHAPWSFSPHCLSLSPSVCASGDTRNGEHHILLEVLGLWIGVCSTLCW